MGPYLTMSLDAALLLSLPPREIRQTFTKRHTILYALGAGVGIPGKAALRARVASRSKTILDNGYVEYESR